MTKNDMIDHLFDLLNESDYLDVYSIASIENGYNIKVFDGTVFNVTVSEAEPQGKILRLYPDLTDGDREDFDEE